MNNNVLEAIRESNREQISLLTDISTKLDTRLTMFDTKLNAFETKLTGLDNKSNTLITDLAYLRGRYDQEQKDSTKKPKADL